MNEYTTTMTERSQVTVPAAVRKILGLKPRDKIRFIVDEGEVRILPSNRLSLEEVVGSVKALPGAPTDIEQLIREAREEYADLKAEEFLNL